MKLNIDESYHIQHAYTLYLRRGLSEEEYEENYQKIAFVLAEEMEEEVEKIMQAFLLRAKNLEETDEKATENQKE